MGEVNKGNISVNCNPLSLFENCTIFSVVICKAKRSVDRVMLRQFIKHKVGVSALPVFVVLIKEIGN